MRKPVDFNVKLFFMQEELGANRLFSFFVDRKKHRFRFFFLAYDPVSGVINLTNLCDFLENDRLHRHLPRAQTQAQPSHHEVQ